MVVFGGEFFRWLPQIGPLKDCGSSLAPPLPPSYRFCCLSSNFAVKTQGLRGQLPPCLQPVGDFLLESEHLIYSFLQEIFI